MKIGQILIKIGSSMSIWPIIKGVKFGGNASVIVEDICKLSRGLGFYWTQCIYEGKSKKKLVTIFLRNRNCSTKCEIYV